MQSVLGHSPPARSVTLRAFLLRRLPETHGQALPDSLSDVPKAFVRCTRPHRSGCDKSERCMCGSQYCPPFPDVYARVSNSAVLQCFALTELLMWPGLISLVREDACSGSWRQLVAWQCCHGRSGCDVTAKSLSRSRQRPGIALSNVVDNGSNRPVRVTITTTLDWSQATNHKERRPWFCLWA